MSTGEFPQKTDKSTDPPSSQSARLHALLTSTLASITNLRIDSALTPQQRDRLEQMEHTVHDLLTEATALFGSPQQPVPAPTTEQALLLVVEDEADTNHFISRALATEFKVISAFDGIEGLEKVHTARPDVILSDLVMPGMGGDELLRAIRQQPETASIPMLVLTAHTDEDLRVQILKEGAQDYLIKPFSVLELMVRVRNLVAMKRARDVLQQELVSQGQDVAVLANELTVRKRDAEHAIERTSRLQEITAALSRAVTPPQVADVIIHKALATLGAAAGLVALLNEDRTHLRVVRAVGYPARIIQAHDTFPVDAPIPAAEAVRTRAPVAVLSVEDWLNKYPDRFPENQAPVVSTGLNARIALPLLIDDGVLGAVMLGFVEAREFSAEDQAFLLALAQQCAQALDRARLYEAERRARAEAEVVQHQLAVLSEVSILLASTLDFETALNNLARLVVSRIADYCVVDVLQADGSLERIGVAAALPEKEAILAESWLRYPVAESMIDVYQVIKTGQSLCLAEVPMTSPPADSDDGDDQDLIQQVRPRSLIIVPLTVRDRKYGALTLWTGIEGRELGSEDLVLCEELARRAAIAIENTQLYREAKQAVASRDEFLSVAAHELKTPITSLRGFAQLLVRQVDKDKTLDLDRLRNALQTVDQQSYRLTHLVTQLLDVSRIEAGRLALDRKRTDLVKLVNGIVSTVRANSDSHAILLSAPPTLEAIIDPLRIEQVITNLIDNAIKYSPGGGTVTVELSLPDDNQASLRISDQGIGIPPEHRQHIFDRFYQANKHNNLGGMGLGLYISRQIVELHGGNIRAEFPPEGGTSFVVSLPLEVVEETG